MSTVEEKTAQSLSADGAEILPYLPYLLQDLWELGSDPAEIIELIQNHVPQEEKLNVLDLACGKGAVSIRITELMQYRIKGIDIIPEFIVEANGKAKQFHVSDQCEYVTGDINAAVEQEKNYDLVILGAVGDVLGTPTETLLKLKNVIKAKGYIIFVDAYTRENPTSEMKSKNGIFPSYDEWMKLLNQVGLVFIESALTDDSKIKAQNEFNNTAIIKRANELKQMHPDQQSLFDAYIQNQLDECSDLDENIAGFTWLLRADEI